VTAAPPTGSRAIRASPRVVLFAWVALLLVLARAGVVCGLSLAHGGGLAVAWLRLAHIYPQILGQALPFALAGVLVAAWSERWKWLAFLARVAFVVLVYRFLAGRFDADPSRGIGSHTMLGLAALSSAGLCAVGLSGLVFHGLRGAWRGAFETSWYGVLPPVVALALLGLYLGFAHDGLARTMDVRSVELDLVGETWEVVRAHPTRPPGPGVLSPAAQYTPEGAARPALVLPPPASMRRVVAGEQSLWLVGGAGLDHEVASEAAALFPGHRVRLRVSVDGSLASESFLPLTGVESWAELGDGAGLRVVPGARIELESALLDPAGVEVKPELPLAAGFGGLALERRERVARTRAAPGRPNVVLVLIDTLRADRTSAYGYARPTTPNLEALARRGTLFEEASATSSWTWPSTASVLTGLYPEEHGVEDAARSFLPEPIDTLAEALQRAGLTSAAWSGSPLIVPEKRFDQGFEFFDASREGRLRRSDIVLPGALEWLESVGEWRFFLYLHLMEPHAPYVPLAGGREQFAAEVPASFDPRKAIDYSWELQSSGFDSHGERRTEAVVSPEEQRWISDLYDGCVWSADHYLGVLLARLEELGLAENTIVAVTSDHGEELFDHGLLTHAHALHRELVRVPLVLAGPGVERGARVTVPVTGAALGPTLARLAGAELAAQGERASLDLFGIVPAESLYSTRQGWWNGSARQPLYGLRRGSAVLHWAPEAAPWGAPLPGPGELRLYDLATDPGEQRDLAPGDPARAQALRAELQQLLERLELHRVETGALPDEGTMEVLEKLGYVGK
jgi:arylsulfatase A-like enzyme